MLKRLPGKAERILSLTFSSDGSLLVAGGGTPARFGEMQFWDPRRQAAQSVLVGGDTVFGASLSPDGKKVAVGCTDNTVHVFDTAGGKELYKISSHENWVLATVFGVDSKRFVSVGRDRAAKLVDAETGQLLENVNQMRGELSAVARHPKKDVIVIGGEDRIPYIYMMDRPRNMKVGEEATLVRKLEAQEGAIFALDWSPDGKVIAVAGAGPKVNLYDAESGEEAGRVQRTLGGNLRGGLLARRHSHRDWRFRRTGSVLQRVGLFAAKGHCAGAGDGNRMKRTRYGSSATARLCRRSP